MDDSSVPPTNPFRTPQPAIVQRDYINTTEKKSILISHHKVSPMTYVDPDGDGEENIDDLIEELASLDGEYTARTQIRKSMESKHSLVGQDPEFDTDITTGLTTTDALARRKKYGPNQLKEEKENLYFKFLSFFVGPVQFVMEVSCRDHSTQYVAMRSS